MNDLFKTFAIQFKDRGEFHKALKFNTFADDVGHSDMILNYSNKFYRDRFVGFLATIGFESTIIIID